MPMNQYQRAFIHSLCIELFMDHLTSIDDYRAARYCCSEQAFTWYILHADLVTIPLERFQAHWEAELALPMVIKHPREQFRLQLSLRLKATKELTLVAGV
jgi:hypothetical protein